MEEFLKLFNLTDILRHVINTVILFVAIRFLVYKPVRKFLNARTDKIAAELDGASAKQAEAERALSEAMAERSATAAEVAQMQTEGATRAQQTGDELIAAAQREAAAIVTRAQEEAAQTRAAAQEAIQQQALVMAVEIAEKMIGRELAQKDNETLAREFLTKVG